MEAEEFELVRDTPHPPPARPAPPAPSAAPALPAAPAPSAAPARGAPGRVEVIASRPGPLPGVGARPVPPIPAARGTWWGPPLLGAAAFVLVWIPGLVLLLPMSSLRSARDGSSLVEDSQTAIAFGLVSLALAGLVAWRGAFVGRRAGSRVVWWPLATGLGLGLLFASVCIGEAEELAQSPVRGIALFDSGETDAAPGGALAMLALTLFVTGVVGGFRRWTGRGAWERLGVVALASLGLGAIVFASWVIGNAERLRVAAEARPHYGTPGLELVALVAALALAALVARR